MRSDLRGFAVACALSVALGAPAAQGQKPGGVLIMSHFDSPASMSMHEEATGAVNRPMMGVFNNLVMFDALIDRQSMESDPEKRRRLVWEIERKLIEDDVRPVLFHPRGAVCNQPWVKGMTQMVNGIYNGSRFEDVWLDK